MAGPVKFLPSITGIYDSYRYQIESADVSVVGHNKGDDVDEVVVQDQTDELIEKQAEELPSSKDIEEKKDDVEEFFDSW